MNRIAYVLMGLSILVSLLAIAVAHLSSQLREHDRRIERLEESIGNGHVRTPTGMDI